jgi:hypothetical protein
MIRQAVFVVAIAPWIGASEGLAQTVSPTPDTMTSASLGLRGGFDSNPTDVLGARGSPFLTQTLDYDYLHGSQNDGWGLKLNAADTIYDPGVAAPSTSAVIAVTDAFHMAPALTLRSTLTTTLDDNWARRSHGVQLRERLEYETSQFRVFTNLDTSLNALNERDIFTLGDFLPSDENFATLTAMAGIAYKVGAGEIGTSLAVSRFAYFAPDILGLDRSHDVVQPNLFFSTTMWNVQLEGSLSPYLAKFDTADFETVRQLLYTAKIKFPAGPWTFGVASTRTMHDTTLPFSAADEATAHEASVSYKITTRDAVDMVARYRRDDYLGLGLCATSFLTGVDYAHDFGSGVLGTISASARQVRYTGEILPWSLNVQFGLQKQFDFGSALSGVPAKLSGTKSPTI